jgi:hypothetical protein
MQKLFDFSPDIFISSSSADKASGYSAFSSLRLPHHTQFIFVAEPFILYLLFFSFYIEERFGKENERIET